MSELEQLKKRIDESGKEGINVKDINSDYLIALKKSDEYEVRKYPQMRYESIYHIYRK